MRRFLSVLLAVSLILGMFVFALPVQAAPECNGGSECPSNGYSDVPGPSNWAHTGIDFCIDAGYMGSTSTKTLTFEPKTLVSRAMVASIMYRIAGAPSGVSYKATFADVPAGKWFTTAIEWAAQNGLASGKGNGIFDPNGDVTRQELAVFMYSLAEYIGSDVSGRNDLSSFEDVSKVPSWAKMYVQWAVDVGLISGKASGGKTYLASKDTATRAEFASIIMRFAELSDPTPPTPPTPVEPLVIVEQPKNATVEEGEAASLSVTVYGGVAPYKYQWYKDYSQISGATSSAYETKQAGSYFCKITDAEGTTVTSSTAVVTVVKTDPLIITSQPQNVTITEGTKATLSVAVSGGTPPYAYQWMMGDSVITGATESVYQTGSEGTYFCKVTDSTGKSVTSASAKVTVTAADPSQTYKIDYKLVEYNVNKGDTYIKTQYIDNSENRTYFSATESFYFNDIVCPGYEFLGWYTAEGERVVKLEYGTTRNLTLYARWNVLTYDITYDLYQTPVTSSPTAEQQHYTVNKGNYNLYYPEINNYKFLGWYDDNGVEYKNIPIGTTGHIVLHAYYTSLRNLAVSKEDHNPIILEDRNNNVVYFTYEIGEIRNIPLNGDKPFWIIQSVAGLSQQVSNTYTTTITAAEASSVSKSISDMTVKSNTWTLSETWNDVTTVNESWAESIGKTSEQCKTDATTSSNTLSISDQAGGSSYHKTEDGTTVYDYDSKTETKDKGHEFNASISGNYTNKMTANLGASTELGASNSYGYTQQGQSGSTAASDKDQFSCGVGYENGFEVNAGLSYGYHNNTTTVTKTGSDSVTVNSNIDENTSSWNSSQALSSTNQHSTSETVRNTLSDMITTTKAYGSSYSKGGTDSSTQGFSSTLNNTSGTTSTVTYSKLESTTTTTTYGVDGKIEGTYRCILVGTAHVFGVVGYDYNTKSYFTYTFSVMDDKTQEFLDYTPKGGDFTDCENSCLPFEIPSDVFDYVAERTVKTTGVSYRTDFVNGTAKIVGYSGSELDVIIPSYVSDGKQAYKVTEIASTAFAGKAVRTVVLGEFIESIPDGAFKNCTNLESVIGSFTKIGDEAFAGCVNLTSMNIPSNVVKIGERAFVGVKNLNVRAINSLCAYSAAVEQLPNGVNSTDAEIEAKQKEITQLFIVSVVNSGAENIVLDLSKVVDGIQFTLDVPAINSIEISGGGKTFNNLYIRSDAKRTTLSEMTIDAPNGTPLIVSSDDLTLHKVFITANSTAIILKKDGVVLSLDQDSIIKSTSQYTAIGSNPEIKSLASPDGATGYLMMVGNFGYVSSFRGEENIEFTNGRPIEITKAEFEKYINGVCYISFDANGGSLPEEDMTMTVFFGSAFGALPTPKRDYYTFAGWYTEKSGGTEVTAQSIFTDGTDCTLYAHWTQNPVSGWVLASDVPAGAQIVNEKWTYTKTTTTESRSTYLSGYTQTGSYWVKEGSGSRNYASFPSGFDTSHWIYQQFYTSPYDSWETTTSKRTVSNSWGGYVYWHWMYDCGGEGGGYRAIYDRYGYGPTNNYLYKYFGAFTSTSGYTYYGTGSYCNNLNMAVYWDTPYSSNADCQGTWFWFRFDYYTSSYTDYYKMFQYKKVENLESYSQVYAGTSGNVTISNVQHYVQYRNK